MQGENNFKTIRHESGSAAGYENDKDDSFIVNHGEREDFTGSHGGADNVFTDFSRQKGNNFIVESRKRKDFEASHGGTDNVFTDLRQQDN